MQYAVTYKYMQNKNTSLNTETGKRDICTSLGCKHACARLYILS